MLNERQLNALPERIYENLNKMNSDYLQKIGEVIKEIGELRPSDVHKLQKLHEYGSTGLAEELANVTAKNVKEIYDIFDLVAQDNYAYAEPFYKASGINYVPYSENEELKEYTRLIAKQTAEEYINFTQTTAFAVFDKTGESIAPLFAAEKDKMKTSLSDTYIKVVDYAAQQVQMGAESYQSAMRDVIKAMADSGIRTVDYATGFSKRLDSAVRQNILWGVKQYNQHSAELIGEDFGADGYEIPYHSNPRPTHAEMGGRLYAKGEAVRIKGVFYPSIKTVEPLLNDYGCLHYKIPVILGVSQPAYSERELEALKEKDNRTFEFEGKRYTGYEAKQTQRQIESAIRKQKDLSIIAGAAGEKDLQLAAQEKLNLLAGKYAKFSKAADLPTRVERLRVEGFKSVKLPQKPLTNAGNGGIIKVQGGKIMNINHIDNPIEQRNTAKGNPNAILQFNRPLNNRQKAILNRLPEYDSKVTLPKKKVNMKDLSALTAATGDEFALFTKGNERLIIRGNSNSVNIDVDKAIELSKQGYKWSGHTHPGISYLSMEISDGDYAVWGCFKQDSISIYNSKGDYRIFMK